MKTSILICGAMRSFDRCLKSQFWQVYRHWPDANFYIVTHDDETAHQADLLGSLVASGLGGMTGQVFERRVTQPEMIAPEGCPGTWTPGKSYMHEPYAISVSPQAVLGQLWLLQEGWKFMMEMGDSAEVIIRTRPDLYFHYFKPPYFLSLNNPAVYHDLDTLALAPWWGRFGGTNDRFAIMGRSAAKAYLCTYSKVPDLVKAGAPLHPETLVKAAVEAAGCVIEPTLETEFSTIRADGQTRPPEIHPRDIAFAPR